ncbi:MAG: peptide-methionine (S)-S-oxide reductase MsrA [Acholeplasmataceae bacterium]
MKHVVLAGGCFWGVEAYFKQLKGVITTSTGYIDGNKRNPTYDEVCQGNATHAEAVEISYDETVISLETLLEHFFRFVNPFSINRQGHDIGKQYRSGVYVDNVKDADLVDAYFDQYFKNDRSRVQTKIKLNLDYDLAEDYHQKYLDKNPGGYCHIDLNLATKDEIK